MRRIARVLALATMIAVAGFATISQAAFFSFPRALKFQLDRIKFNTPALAPMAHTRFCMHYQADCEVQGVDFRRRNIALTEARWKELTTVDRQVNRDIRPQPKEGGLLTEEWLVAPPAGDCHDYAVTKRHELLARGWPSRSLLLSEVITASREHHLVLIVRTQAARPCRDHEVPNAGACQIADLQARDRRHRRRHDRPERIGAHDPGTDREHERERDGRHQNQHLEAPPQHHSDQ